MKRMLTLFAVAWVSISCGAHAWAQDEKTSWVLESASAGWQPRDSQGELVFDDKLWILGGWFDSFEAPPRDVWASGDGKDWKLIEHNAPWIHSDLPMSIAFKDRMWIMGGWHNGRLPGHSASNQVWSSSDGVAWKQESEAAEWTPRLASAIVEFKGRMWILGGTENYYFGDEKSLKNDVWSSADGKHWKLETASADWSPRAYHQAAVLGDRIYVFGGGNYVPAYDAKNDVWSSADGVTWRLETAAAPWSPRLWFSAAVYRDRIWVLGGWSNNPSINWGDAWFTQDGRTWQHYSGGPMWKQRHEHSAFVFRDKLWIAGGHAQPLSSEVWSLSLPADWSPSIAPSDRGAPWYVDRRNLLFFQDDSAGIHPVRTADDWSRRTAHIRSNMELTMGKLPAPSPLALDLKVDAETHLEKYTRRHVTFVTEANDHLPGWLLLPHGASADDKRPGIICLPGSSEPGKDAPAGLTERADMAYGHELAELGYVCLVLDYPLLHTKEYKTDPYALGYDSATMKGIVNHRRGVDLLRSLPEVDAESIGVIGHSLGGHNALFLAVFDERVKAVVSSCGYNAFAKHNGGNVSAWSNHYYMPRIKTIYGDDPAKIPFDFTEVLAALAPRPVFTNAPLHDAPDFEVSGVRDCIAAALPVYRDIFKVTDRLEVYYPDAGHAFPEAERHAAYAFLDKHLRAAPR
jgi:dienelactone hydrolase